VPWRKCLVRSLVLVVLAGWGWQARRAYRVGDDFFKPEVHLSVVSREGQPGVPQRVCDGCGKKIPSMSKLATRENGRDLCLACQIRLAQEEKGLRH
jgi:hypothetical protein